MYSKTRYPNFRYAQIAPGVWRIIQSDDPNGSFIGGSTGPIYHSKTELLTDLDRVAREWGY